MGRRVEGGFGFVVEGAGLGGLLAQAFDDVGGGFGHEGLVAELAFGGGKTFFILGEVFGEALALGGDVDLALVEDGYVEARSVLRALLPVRGFGGDLDSS